MPDKHETVWVLLCLLLITAVKSPFPFGVVNLKQVPLPLGSCHWVLVSSVWNVKLTRLKSHHLPLLQGRLGLDMWFFRMLPHRVGRPHRWENQQESQTLQPSSQCTPDQDKLRHPRHLSQPPSASCHPSPALFSAPAGQGTDLQAQAVGKPKANFPFLQARRNFHHLICWRNYPLASVSPSLKEEKIINTALPKGCGQKDPLPLSIPPKPP